jgi:EmrB/QacA subfamily drug resistance transporter
VLIAMCLGLMLSMLNSTLVNVTTPQIGTDLHASVTDLQWVADIYTLGYAGLLLPGGALGNRLGRRTAFLLGTGIFLAGSALCALAPDLAVLLGARVVQSVGAATMLPQTLSIVVTEYQAPAARARAVGIWAGVASLGLAAGPVLGGVCLAVADWRAGFGLVAVLAAAAWYLARRVVPAERHGRPATTHRLDVPGALLGVLALTALVYSLIEAGSYGWTAPRILAGYAVAVLAAAGFARVELRTARRGGNPLMPLAMWRSGGFVAANAAGLAYFLALFGILFFYSLELQQIRGYSALATGALFLPMTVCMALFAPVAGRLTNRFGLRPVLAFGLALTGAGCLLLATQPYGDGLPGLEWRLALVGAGSGLMSSTMSNAAVSTIDRRYVTMASAVHNTCRQIGSTLGVALLGAALHARQTGALGAPLAKLRDPAARSAVKAAARHGSTSPAEAVGHLPAATRRALDAAAGHGFESGLHLAMLISALILFACAATAAALLRPRP